MKRDLQWLLIAVVLTFAAAMAMAKAQGADNLQAQLVKVSQENLEASNREDLVGVLKTMSAEMPQRELFIEQCKKEWAQSDVYCRLDNLQVVRVQLPYAVANVTETITGGEGAPEDLSDTFHLRTKNPTNTHAVLFKRERGKWKIVAALGEEESQAMSPCANGSCRTASAFR